VKTAGSVDGSDQAAPSRGVSRGGSHRGSLTICKRWLGCSGPGCRIRNPLQSAVASNTAADVTPAQKRLSHATNAADVEGVVEAIESQVERLLPEGISKNARNRMAGEIYRELDSTLRTSRFDAANS